MWIKRIGFFALMACVSLSAYGEGGGYLRPDKTWINGLSGSSEPVAMRLARALSGSDGVGEEDVCGCAINGRGEIVDPAHCPVVFQTRDESMAKTMAVPLVTPSDWAWNLACFKEGAPGCKSPEGASYIGETCCRMVDNDFARIKGDLNFYLLAPAPIAKRISGYRYAESPNGILLDEGCSVLVDDRRLTWSLTPEWTGFYARIWLYAADHYSASAPFALGVLRKMSAANRPTTKELERAKYVANGQGGRGNRETLGP